jgi:hypothetical protein
MYQRKLFKNMLLGGFSLLLPIGCGHRQGTVAATSGPKIAPVVPQTLAVIGPSVRTFKSTPPVIQFDYPADWIPDKAETACFAVTAPVTGVYSSLSLDIPKLPWHLPGMITVNMVAGGYLQDLKKNQIHDAVVKENCEVKVPGAQARRLVSVGTEHGKPSIDVAVVMVHADQVYILSADSDQNGCDLARKALDDAVASLKWAK